MRALHPRQARGLLGPGAAGPSAGTHPLWRIAGFYGVYSVYNVNLEIGKLEVPGKFINYASCGDDQ